MTKKWRISWAMAAMFCAGIVSRTEASPLEVLSLEDVQHYGLAFKAVDRGDYVDAALQTTEIADPALTGYISFHQLMHPTAHKSDFGELSNWLGRYGDLPMAQRLAGLAMKRRPADAEPSPAGAPLGTAWSRIELVPPGAGGPFDVDNARLAREAFYSGDIRRALDLAKATGDRWIAGMAAYRLKRFDQAEIALSGLLQDPSEDVWVRAGGAFWAARAAEAQIAKDPAALARMSSYLRQAAAEPQTFYGMIAQRQVALKGLGEPIALTSSPIALDIRRPIKASQMPANGLDLAGFVRDDPRAHRAAALAQIGRVMESAQELRLGLSLAAAPGERQKWETLAAVLNAQLAEAAAPPAAVLRVGPQDYPTPSLSPNRGFTISRALVYAIVRQESRFNPGVVSAAGAVGLMQLMPDTAVHASGDSRLRDNMSSLFDPGLNLKVGQDYVAWLMSQGVGFDILRTVAAYNGGPATLQKTAQMLGDDDESLMVIECMPAPETRDYVEKVMAAYWTYRKKFGQDVGTLDALAGGQKYIDARWDGDPAPVARANTRHAGRKGLRGHRHHG